MYSVGIMENTPTTTPQIDNDKLWGILAYVCVPIPLILTKSRSAFLTYHLNQGIILFVVMIIGFFGVDLLPWWAGLLTIISWIWKALVIALIITGVKHVLSRTENPYQSLGNCLLF